MFFLTQDYTSLIQSGGPVLIAFFLLSSFLFIFGVKVGIPALRLAREITLEVANITRTLKNKVERLEAIADTLEDHTPCLLPPLRIQTQTDSPSNEQQPHPKVAPSPRRRPPPDKSIYDS